MTNKLDILIELKKITTIGFLLLQKIRKTKLGTNCQTLTA